ncbi:hypothetical protein J6590_065983 [Homalodisca vitripennis]|nr:hypothetical protein J6590_065983 [Homalodisca vitripennis]
MVTTHADVVSTRTMVRQFSIRVSYSRSNYLHNCTTRRQKYSIGCERKERSKVEFVTNKSASDNLNMDSEKVGEVSLGQLMSGLEAMLDKKLANLVTKEDLVVVTNSQAERYRLYRVYPVVRREKRWKLMAVRREIERVAGRRRMSLVNDRLMIEGWRFTWEDGKLVAAGGRDGAERLRDIIHRFSFRGLLGRMIEESARQEFGGCKGRTCY